ncbi:MAG: TIGR00725 family protein [Deltaproteobacteria bacterium]|nr:TIGR00725 family protein [Deltaproteobacteria bacterium]
MRVRNISVIGSSGIISDDVKELAEAVGKYIGESTFNLVCGGRDGVMEAVCRGMSTVKGKKGSIIGILPGYDFDGANSFCEVVIPTGIGYARNSIVANSGDIVIIIAGATGTLTEAAFAWSYNKPLVAMVKSGGIAKELAGKVLDYRSTVPVYTCETIDELDFTVKKIINENKDEQI